MDEQFEFLKEIATRLQNAGLHYMTTGSVAFSIYAPPRMTRDLDFVIELKSEDIGKFCNLFNKDCVIEENAVRGAVNNQGMFNIIHKEWIIKADFIIRKNEPYREVEFQRRRIFHVMDFSLAVTAPEDLILSKLCWAKDSDSELQRRDVTELIKSVDNLDWTYLYNWASKLELIDLLENCKRNE